MGSDNLWRILRVLITGGNERGHYYHGLIRILIENMCKIRHQLVK